MPKESNFTPPSTQCPQPELWTAIDEQASEDEVHEFLYSLVRLFKPRTILETGCYKGGATLKLAQAAAANGFGSVHTCDTAQDMIDVTLRRCEGLNVSIHCCDGVELAQLCPNIDLAFLDSGGDRLAEAMALQLSPQGIVVLHDAKWPVRAQIKEAMGWKDFYFPTPRGLALFQR